MGLSRRRFLDQTIGDQISNSLFLYDDGAANSGGEVFAGNGNISAGNQYFCNSASSTRLNSAGVDFYALQIGVTGTPAA